MKANPKKWFPNEFSARISFRKVDVWAERLKEHHPYFDTWEQARSWALERGEKKLAMAKKEQKRAEQYLAKIKAMEAPHE